MKKATLRELAFRAVDQDCYAAAVELFGRHLKLQPDDVLARLVLADNLRILGRHKEARSAMVPAKAMPSKKLWLGFLYKGKLHMDLGEFKLAEACFRKITTLDPGSTSGWVYLANSLAKQERFAEACQVSKLGLKAKGDIDEVYFNLGLNKQALGKYKEARRCFEKALELDPQYKEAKRACKDLELLERALKQLKMK